MVVRPHVAPHVQQDVTAHHRHQRPLKSPQQTEVRAWMQPVDGYELLRSRLTSTPNQLLVTFEQLCQAYWDLIRGRYFSCGRHNRRYFPRPVNVN